MKNDINYKPDLQYTPKEIKGDVKVPTSVPKNISIAGNKPDENLRTDSMGITGEELPVANPRDLFSPEIQKEIDEVVDNLDVLEKGLDDIDMQIEDKLKDFSLECDAAKFPLLNKALRCPFCGNIEATNTIGYNDIKQKKKVGEHFKEAMLAKPFGLTAKDSANAPGYYGAISGTDLTDKAAHQSITENFLMDTKNMIWNQFLKEILIMILTFLYSLFKPLAVTIVLKPIPDMFRRAIDNLRVNKESFNDAFENTKNQFTEDSTKFEDEFTHKSIDSPDVTKLITETQNDVNRRPSISTDELRKALPKSNFFQYPLTCMEHVASFNSISFLESKWDLLFKAKELNQSVKTATKDIKDKMSIVIPQNYQSQSGKFFNNTLPKEAQEKFNYGDTSWKTFKNFGSAFGGGFKEILNKGTQDYLKNMQKLMKNWLLNGDILCCLIRNLLTLQLHWSTPKELMKLLSLIRAILVFWKNGLELKAKVNLGDIGNILVKIVTAALDAIMTPLISEFMNNLSKSANDFFTKLGWINDIASWSNCVPFKDLLNITMEGLNSLLKKLWAYIESFYKNIHLTFDVAVTTGDLFCKIRYIDNIILIIDAILKFNLAWTACANTPQNVNKTAAPDLGNGRFNLDEIKQQLLNKFAQNSYYQASSPYPEAPFLFTQTQGYVKPNSSSPDYTGNKFGLSPNINDQIASQNDSQSVNKETINGNEAKQMAMSATTMYIDEPIIGININDKEQGLKKQDFKNKLLLSDQFPWSDTGMKVLLTNYLGISEADAIKAISGNDCGCDDVLSTDELLEIKENLKNV